jgi:hypothetical protein
LVRAREYSVVLSEELASNLLERLHIEGCAAAFVQANPVLDHYKLSGAEKASAAIGGYNSFSKTCSQVSTRS